MTFRARSVECAAPDEDPAVYAARRSWQAIILTALVALKHLRSPSPYHQKDAAVALAWLIDPEEEESLRMVCELAGWRVEMVRRNAARALAGEVTWRKPHRQRGGARTVEALE